ncbi:MAG TPA: hypothetical protein VFZ91_00180 [Allosphingosinicella sp.]
MARSKLGGFLIVLSLVAAGGMNAALTQIPRPIPKPIPKPLPKPKPAPQPRAPAPKAKPKPARSAPLPRRTATPPLPPSVQAHLASLCARTGARVGDAQASVESGDFNGDGQRDYFVDERRVRCAGTTRTYRPGDRFDARLFIAVGADAVARAQYRVLGAAVDRSAGFPSLWLEMDGVDCGNAPAGQRCRNRLAWDAARGTLSLAERVYVDASGRVSAQPAWPPIAASIPAEFAAGTIKLKKSGGCTRFYTLGGRAQVAQAVNQGDWNGAVRSVIDQGCSTNIAWFVLGAAAERFGRIDAARHYYTQAMELSLKPSLSNIYRICAGVNLPNPCLGMDVPTESARALGRLDAVQ